MVLLFHMKQILILVRTVFVKWIYLSGDLKTINCHINLLDYYSKERSVLPVSAIICWPDFPCFNRYTPLHFYSIAWVFPSLSVRPVDQQRRQLAVRFYPRWWYVRSRVGVSAGRIGFAMNRFCTKQTKIFGPKTFIFDFLKLRR